MAVGRPKGSVDCKYYRWLIVICDKNTGNIIDCNKYFTIADFNNKNDDIYLTGDYVKKIMTNDRVDTTGKLGKDSFVAKYGHIKIQKIKEVAV
tara:strand:- start:464 stop:742 length:279 start_codon:yes stop_codon:yes gene_type:complete